MMPSPQVPCRLSRKPWQSQRREEPFRYVIGSCDASKSSSQYVCDADGAQIGTEAPIQKRLNLGAWYAGSFGKCGHGVYLCYAFGHYFGYLSGVLAESARGTRDGRWDRRSYSGSAVQGLEIDAMIPWSGATGLKNISMNAGTLI